jgi:hypothetical protein
MPFDVSPPLTVNPFAFIVNFFLVMWSKDMPLVQKFQPGNLPFNAMA